MLDEILAAVRDGIARQKRRVPLSDLEQMVRVRRQRRSLRQALSGRPFGIIAEVKKASPSAGLIKKRYLPVVIARRYEREGASAISVITCGPFFQGTVGHLRLVSTAVELPVLRKDFIVDEYQLFEAAANGADAALLIARILSAGELVRLAQCADKLGLEQLIEVHDGEDIRKALRLPSWETRILGFNNRNLDTLKTSLETTFHLKKMVADDTIITVSESGISESDQIARLYDAGIRGALVGYSLLTNTCIGELLRKVPGEQQS